MKKLDKITKSTNVILGVLYVPFSMFCWLLQMASESTIDATNPIYIKLIEIFCFVSFLIPIFCVVGITVSVVFRKKGHSVGAFIIQFLPIIAFALNLVLMAVAESLPRII